MKRDDKIFCNQCGKELQQQEDMVREGYFSADVVFGYFSNKDGLRLRHPANADRRQRCWMCVCWGREE